MLGMLMGLAVATGTAAGEEELLAVNAGDVPKLWTLTRGDSQAEALGRLTARAGCVAVSYVIEKTGRVGDIKVLRTFPEDESLAEAAYDMLGDWAFEPTKLNAKHLMPVYTVQVFTFKNDAMLKGDVGTHRKPKKIDMGELAKACYVEQMNFGS